jgi:hypothetical protein
MPGERPPGVVVEGLAKSFGSVRALAGIDLTVEPGTVLGLLGRGGAQVDNQTGQVVVPVGGDGSDVLIEVVRRLDAAAVPIADLSLRRPTLDDVFLALTGRTAEGDGENQDGQHRGRGGRQKAEARS